MIRSMKKTPKNRIAPKGDSEESQNTRFRIEALAVIRAVRYLIWLAIAILTLVFTWKSL